MPVRGSSEVIRMLVFATTTGVAAAVSATMLSIAQRFHELDAAGVLDFLRGVVQFCVDRVHLLNEDERSEHASRRHRVEHLADHAELF